MIANIDAESARRIAEECLRCDTADDAEELIRQRLSEGWPHLFSPESLPTPKSADKI